ncbi:ABC transporter ATP-binding protein [Halocynthiibacter sp.]|uniref:ABC transporter ATP-binding protein n=1 Tax=Halocynthiibacter sp. TaxID=1979210 RepID=UPI003C651900
MSSLTLTQLRKSYGKTEVLKGIELSVQHGEFIVLVGPSGCGKSTTLRLIAGLEDATSGDISIGDQVVNNLEPRDRDIAMVFQNYAIYPHMSVKKNIAFGLRTSKLSKAEKEARIQEVAGILDMVDLLDRKPNQLSGGQRQRVAIGRAMVRNPAVFLFDEPLSNLDAQLRTQMRLEIKKLHQRVQNTVVFVTHDQVEAMTMADRIVIMKDGHIQQVGTPEDVYRQPDNVFVAQFIGAPSMNVMDGRVENGRVMLGDVILPVSAGVLPDGCALKVGIRPDDLVLNSTDPVLHGRVSLREPLGPETLLYVQTALGEVILRAPGRMPPEVDETVVMGVGSENIHLFRADTGERLS